MAEKSSVELRWEVGPRGEGQFPTDQNFVEFEVDVDRPLPQEAFELLDQVVYDINRLAEVLGQPPADDDFVRRAIEKIEATRARVKCTCVSVPGYDGRLDLIPGAIPCPLHPNARVRGRLVFSVPIGDVDPDLRVFEWSRLEPLLNQALREAYEADFEHLGEMVNRTLANLELIRVHTRVEL